MTVPAGLSFGEVLKYFRKQKRLNQTDLALRIGMHRNSVSYWERGERLPETRASIEELARVLELDEQETRLLQEARFGTASILTLYNLPAERNLYFTGREATLVALHRALTAKNLTQAISGLGGIGKTQTALEYANRYQSHYNYILWTEADSREILVASCLKLARALNLLERNVQEDNQVLEMLRRWLGGHQNWLLILDNVDDLDLVKTFQMSGRPGAILLTTRRQVTEPLAQSVALENLSEQEGTSFLLKRTKLLALDASFEEASRENQLKARTISRNLGGLPLALDQAGAYILEKGRSLADYLGLYERRYTDLLRLRGSVPTDHPASVTTTFSLAFEQAKQANQTSAELLRLCAFLHAEAIPEELITQGAANFGSVLQPIAIDPVLLDEAIEALRKYSLIQRDPETKALRIHRLVQAVLQDTLEETTKRTWAELAMHVVNAAFPEAEHKTWPQCERLLMQALTVIQTAELYQSVSEETGDLLSKTGSYLRERAQYLEAEPLLLRALAIFEQRTEADYPNIARSLNNLAELYRQQGKFELAEPLLQRALSIREQHLGATHPDTVRNMNNLSILYWQQGKFELAEPLLQQTIFIYEQISRSAHPDMARSLNGLANLYLQQGKFEQAEPLYQRALAIWEPHLGADHPHVAACRNNLAELYRQQGKFELAEPLFQQALSIFQQLLGTKHPDTARSLNNLAELYRQQGKFELAEPLFQQALSIYEQHLVGNQGNHLDTAESLYGLAKIYQSLNKYEQAEPLLQRALSIREKMLGSTHSDTVTTLKDYTQLIEERKQAQEERAQEE